MPESEWAGWTENRTGDLLRWHSIVAQYSDVNSWVKVTGITNVPCVAGNEYSSKIFVGRVPMSTVRTTQNTPS